MKLALTMADAGRSALLPISASENAATTDWMFMFIWYLSSFFFILIVALMVIFALRYRRKTPDQQPTGTATHSTVLELAWGLPPLVIVMFIFWVSMSGYLQTAVPYANAMKIDVRANLWSWQFIYELPDGGVHVDGQLHIPIDTPIELTMTSDNVIHSLFIPAFRIKRDVVPGKYNKVWFKATRAGVYPLLCAEYCGNEHSSMATTVIVHEPGGYEQWLAEASRSAFGELSDELFAEWIAIDSVAAHDAFVEKLRASDDPELADKAEQLKPAFVEGEDLYRKRGCAQCHSLDGTSGTGPTLKGLWMKERVLADGTTRVADEEYLHDSILFPKKDVVVPYPNVMPEYPLDPHTTRARREADAIVQFIRSLKD